MLPSIADRDQTAHLEQSGLGLQYLLSRLDLSGTILTTVGNGVK